MEKLKKNKLILITGGKSGIGLSIAKEMIARGNTVIITSRKFQSADVSNKKKYNNLIKCHLDVTNEASVKKLFSLVQALGRKLDVLINNAGVGIFKPFKDVSFQDWESTIKVNLTGSFLCIKEACSIMRLSKGGRIINIGSIAEKIPLADNLVYGTSKYGLRFLSAAVNEEEKFNKIRVTHVTLGATYTNIWKSREGFAKKEMLEKKHVANLISGIADLPLSIRVDNIEILPEKGIL